MYMKLKIISLQLNGELTKKFKINPGIGMVTTMPKLLQPVS